MSLVSSAEVIVISSDEDDNDVQKRQKSSYQKARSSSKCENLRWNTGNPDIARGLRCNVRSPRPRSPQQKVRSLHVPLSLRLNAWRLSIRSRSVDPPNLRNEEPSKLQRSASVPLSVSTNKSPLTNHEEIFTGKEDSFGQLDFQFGDNPPTKSIVGSQIPCTNDDEAIEIHCNNTTAPPRLQKKDSQSSPVWQQNLLQSKKHDSKEIIIIDPDPPLSLKAAPLLSTTKLPYQPLQTPSQSSIASSKQMKYAHPASNASNALTSLTSPTTLSQLDSKQHPPLQSRPESISISSPKTCSLKRPRLPSPSPPSKRQKTISLLSPTPPRTPPRPLPRTSNTPSSELTKTLTTATASTRRPRARAWTSAMLADLATSLQASFDFTAFGQKYEKSSKEIFDVFSAVVQVPLLEHSAKGLARIKMKEFGRKMKEYKEMGRGGRIGNNVKKESKIPKDRESVKNKEETSLLKKTKTGGVLEKAVNSEEKKGASDENPAQGDSDEKIEL